MSEIEVSALKCMRQTLIFQWKKDLRASKHKFHMFGNHFRMPGIFSLINHAPEVETIINA